MSAGFPFLMQFAFFLIFGDFIALPMNHPGGVHPAIDPAMLNRAMLTDCV